MNILLITGLFPTNIEDNETSSTFALYYLIKNFKGHNIKVLRSYLIPTFISNDKKRPKQNQFNFKGIETFNFPIIKIPRTLFYFFKLSNRIWEMITKFNPDIILAHNCGSFYVGDKIAKEYGIPFICGIHNTDIRRINWPGKKRLKSILNKTKTIACRTSVIRNKLVDEYPDLSKKTFVAFSGTEKSIIEKKTIFLSKAKLISDKNNILFVTIGRLLKLKNIDINLKVLSSLPKSLKWTYNVIGDGPELPRLKKLSRTYGIDKKVNFYGYLPREKAIELLKESNIFIMVSAPETFGIVYLEAMAKGNIVIGAKNQGIDGVVKNQYNGFLCEPRNEKDLEHTIKSILIDYDPEDLKKIILNSYETIQKYTMESASANYLDHILK